MGEVLMSRKNLKTYENTFKSLNFMPIFIKVDQWARFESLAVRFWPAGLRFDTPDLYDLGHCLFTKCIKTSRLQIAIIIMLKCKTDLNIMSLLPNSF